MRKLVKLTFMFATLFGVAGLSSCNPKEEVTASLTAPKDLKAENVTDVSAVLSWSGDATGYEVIVGDAEAKQVTGPTYTATGLSAETRYEWKVRAIDGDRSSKWVDGEAFTTESASETVAKPTALDVTGTTATTATFVWEGTTTSYEISVGDDITETVNAKTFTAEGLTAGNEYEWKVRAIDGERTSEWAYGEAFTTELAPVAKPTGLDVTEVTHNSATFVWEGAATTYEIVVGDDITETVNAKTFTAEGLDPETGYAWKVRAIDGERTSEWAEGEAFTTEAEPVAGYDFIRATYAAYSATNFAITLNDRPYVENNRQGAAMILDFYRFPENSDRMFGDGTYVVNGSNSPGTIDPTYSKFVAHDSNRDAKITGGTMEISGTGANYTVVIDLIGTRPATETDPEEEVIIKGTYVGPITLP